MDASPRRLIDVLRPNRTASGGFMDLYNDLAPVWKPELDPLIQMAYAYARRIATCGLFFQGVAQQEHMDQTEKIFRSLQMTTGQTVDFQEAASAQANEVAAAYLPEFSYSHLMVVIAYARQGMDAEDVASIPALFMDVAEDRPPYSVDTCFAVADALVQQGFRTQPGLPTK